VRALPKALDEIGNPQIQRVWGARGNAIKGLDPAILQLFVPICRATQQLADALTHEKLQFSHMNTSIVIPARKDPLKVLVVTQLLPYQLVGGNDRFSSRLNWAC
jgi:hypothetical protein